MIKKQFTLYLANKPGELAKTTRLLADEDINIDAISVSASADVGLVQLVPGNARAVSRLLSEENIPFTTQDVVVVALPNRVGALNDLMEKMARLKVNVSYVYGTGSSCGVDGDTLVVISAPDLEKLQAVLDKGAAKKPVTRKRAATSTRKR